MRRREFLRLSALAPLGAMSLRLDAVTVPSLQAEPVPDGRPHRFALGVMVPRPLSTDLFDLPLFRVRISCAAPPRNAMKAQLFVRMRRPTPA